MYWCSFFPRSRSREDYELIRDIIWGISLLFGGFHTKNTTRRCLQDGFEDVSVSTARRRQRLTAEIASAISGTLVPPWIPSSSTLRHSPTQHTVLVNAIASYQQASNPQSPRAETLQCAWHPSLADAREPPRCAGNALSVEMPPWPAWPSPCTCSLGLPRMPPRSSLHAASNIPGNPSTARPSPPSTSCAIHRRHTGAPLGLCSYSR